MSMKHLLCRKTICFFVLSILTFTATNTSSHQKIWPGKQLKETMPQATRFTSQQVSLNSTQVERIERALKVRLGQEDLKPTFYPAYQGEEKIGMVIFVDETGQNGIIEIGVAFNRAGEIAAVKILDHRERGGIKKEEFLGQFIGKSSRDISSMEESIVPHSGAIEASKAVIRGIKKALLIKQEVFGH
jgi:Na+-translocating ferredoxin:NAD+ oxidoreductase RnfG subunit